MRYKCVSHAGITTMVDNTSFTNGISDEHLAPSQAKRFCDLGFAVEPYPEGGDGCDNCEILKKEIAHLTKELEELKKKRK
jgi:hypothetical protein